MITLAEIDTLRGLATRALEEYRATQHPPPDGWSGVCGCSICYSKRAHLNERRLAVESALGEWWAQGCRGVPMPVPVTPAAPRPARCDCGAYPWPKNMADGGVIGDAASHHRATGCTPHPMLGSSASVVLNHLATVLFMLTSDVPDSKLDEEQYDWRKRVKETMIRNGIVIDPDNVCALSEASQQWCCCGKVKLSKQKRVLGPNNGYHERQVCRS